MALLQNGYRDFSSGVRIFGATVSNSAYPYALLSNRWRTSTSRNLTAGEGITTELAGIPDGYRDRASWVMPQKPGALASRNQISGAGAATIAMAGGVNGEATLAGTGALSGIGALIISMVAALTGSPFLMAADDCGAWRFAGATGGADAVFCFAMALAFSAASP